MTEPAKHYQQHHDVSAPQVNSKAFRQGWRVSTRLDGLLRDGLIDSGTWQTAVDYRSTWERAFGIGLGGSGEVTGGGRVNSFDRIAAGRLDAVETIREFVQLLGERRMWLVDRCVLHDYAWLRTAEALKITDKTAKVWTAEALRALRRCCMPSESALPVVVSEGF